MNKINEENIKFGCIAPDKDGIISDLYQTILGITTSISVKKEKLRLARQKSKNGNNKSMRSI